MTSDDQDREGQDLVLGLELAIRGRRGVAKEETGGKVLVKRYLRPLPPPSLSVLKVLGEISF